MSDRKVITPTDARQATPQQTNYRVLTRSLIIAVIVAAVVYGIFYLQSPA
jgi:predicted secreted protein